MRWDVWSGLDRSYDERVILAAEAEAVAKSGAHRQAAGLVGDVVQIAVGIGQVVVDRRRDHAVANRSFQTRVVQTLRVKTALPIPPRPIELPICEGWAGIGCLRRVERAGEGVSRRLEVGQGASGVATTHDERAAVLSGL
jgi:hypothetical protein